MSRSDLDGLHIELSASDHLMSQRYRRLARGAVLLIGIAMSIYLPLVTNTAIGVLWLIFPFSLWKMLGKIQFGATRHHLLLGQHHLIFETLGERVQWIDIGQVIVLNTLHPVLELKLHNRPALHLPMENEPVAHARWLATTLMRRAREARESQGSRQDIPTALRELQ